MSIIGTISSCIDRIPSELMEDKILYVEVDKVHYDGIEEEFAKITNDTNYSLNEERIADMGLSKIFIYQDYKIIITLRPTKVNYSGTESFYIAFKTKIV